MGGLRRYLRVTFVSKWIATLAIGGAPFFSGFFSKDQILWEAYASPHGHMAFWLAGVLVAGLTAVYMSRLMFLTFHGTERFKTDGAHPTPQEPSVLVTFPLMILAFFSVIAGYIGLPGYLGTNRLAEFLAPSFQWVREEAMTVEHSHSEELVLTVIVVAVAALGFLAAYQLYVRDRQMADRLAQRFSLLHQTFSSKFSTRDSLNRRPVLGGSPRPS